MTEVLQYQIEAWQQPGWRTAVDAWVAERLAEHGLRVTGPAEDRARPWALVSRVPTDAGPVWFKACTVGVAHEVGIYEVLQRRAPGHVLTPLAADPAAGWLLLPDGGRTLRVAEGGRADVAAWERMLAEYADLQRSLEAHVDELLGVGVPDARPEAMPGIRDALLADRALMMVGEERGLTPEQWRQLLADADGFAAVGRMARRSADEHRTDRRAAGRSRGVDRRLGPRPGSARSAQKHLRPGAAPGPRRHGKGEPARFKVGRRHAGLPLGALPVRGRGAQADGAAAGRYIPSDYSIAARGFVDGFKQCQQYLREQR